MKTTWTSFVNLNCDANDIEVVVRGRRIDYIFIEAPRDEAIEEFIRRFHVDPQAFVTCLCCEETFATFENMSLQQLTGGLRNCLYDSNLGEFVEEQEPLFPELPYETLGQYVERPDVVVIFRHEVGR